MYHGCPQDLGLTRLQAKNMTVHLRYTAVGQGLACSAASANRKRRRAGPLRFQPRFISLGMCCRSLNAYKEDEPAAQQPPSSAETTAAPKRAPAPTVDAKPPAKDPVAVTASAASAESAAAAIAATKTAEAAEAAAAAAASAAAAQALMQALMQVE